MQKKHLNVPFEIKSVSATGEFEGYGSVFGVEDSYGDVVMPGAFKRTLSEWSQKVVCLPCCGSTNQMNPWDHIWK